MQAFKLKAFARFQRREKLKDAKLAVAVRNLEQGLVDADLGGGLVKQRIARQGQGKSGGWRTLIAYRRGERAVFLFGFAKSEQDNIDDDELEALRTRGRAFLALSAEQLAKAIDKGDILEVDYDEAD